MYCRYCGSKLKENATFCGECGEKILNTKTSNNFSENMKQKVSEIDKKIEEKLPNNLKKNRNVIYIVIGVIVVLFIILLLTRGYSQNIQIVRSWQNTVLADENVTFGEAMDYALVNEKWKDTIYEGEKAVILTGTYRENGVRMKAIFYVNRENRGSMFAYYEEDGNKRSSADIAFRVSEYAEETREYLHR